MFLKYFKQWLYCEIGSNDYRVFKSFYLKVDKHLTKKELLKDRLMLLIRVASMPLLLRHKKYVKIEKYMIEDLASYSLRKKYIKAYDKDVDIGLIERRFKSNIEVQSWGELWIFTKSYFSALFSILKIIFIPLNFSLLQFSNYYYMRSKILILEPKKIYMFYSYLPHMYLISLFSSNIKRIEVDYIIANMINESLRYSHFENVQVCFTNTLYKEEYQAFQKIGWIKDMNVNYLVTGNEFLINNKLAKFEYDIGFFSSAFWARRDGLYADYNIEALKKEQYKNNIYFKEENIILRNTIKVAKKYNLNMKIYLHPYEKNLISKYNIYPPYWDLLQSDILEESKSMGSNNFFEAKVGVLLQSSIFYDRWEYDLFTICYQFKNSKNKLQIPLKYLGCYSIYGFENEKDFEEQVINGLKYT